jgi:hypothetical protein
MNKEFKQLGIESGRMRSDKPNHSQPPNNTALLEVDVAEDPDMTLTEWKAFINTLIKRHGKYARMRTDGGYNNVNLIVKEQ